MKEREFFLVLKEESLTIAHNFHVNNQLTENLWLHTTLIGHTYLPSVGDDEVLGLRLEVADRVEYDFGVVDHDLREELVLQLVQFLHNLLVNFTVLGGVYHTDLRSNFLKMELTV